MVKPNDILLPDQRSEKAQAADKLAEQLISQRQRLFGITLWSVILAEAAFWYFDLGLWIRIVVPLIWVGFLVHNFTLVILHELWELNDQISGRKDEFRQVISRQSLDRERE